MVRRPRKLSGLTTKLAMQKFLDSRKAKNLNADSIYWYKRHISAFMAHSPQRVAYVKADHIRSFLALCINQGLSENTVHGRYRALRAFFNFLYEEKHITSNPMEKVAAPRVGKVIIKTYTREELECFFSVIDRTTFVGLRDYALLFLLYDTCIRISEALGIKTKDVFPQHLYVLGKGNKERLVPFGQKARSALDQYLPELGTSEYLFVNEDNKKLSRKNVDDRIKKYAKIAGITDKRNSAHTFRHTAAVDFLRNGGDLRSLQEILGHTSMKMVERYTQLLDDDIKNAHRKASPGDRLKI